MVQQGGDGDGGDGEDGDDGDGDGDGEDDGDDKDGDGQHRFADTQEGATARLLSLGSRLSPNDQDNQVMMIMIR